MTRKDYEKLATVIKFEREQNEYGLNVQETLYSLASRLADMLKLDNPRFNRARFLKACGF